ncbi:dihydroxyacetone kinase [Sphaerisporangium melleum]|uniref:Dihydroxyacetone kinase n=1 Tax=Sphaerisporangium melleum TaxID=321316 RepID=A0A917QVP9_9ACTN|nr:DAK2 domain-containing protein [Sphaerisporangium melleum]GGK69895.1 dihydroxyacetone kinase [Sphaerisporangium melleum]GII70348.1 dihydroxyacetone kinase [Sphaerisporangium melleum]
MPSQPAAEALRTLDPAAVRRWSRLCADSLGRVRAEIDALNVFPVPDGDTGTNLHLTMLSAAEAVEALPPGADAGATWRTLARGALLGARGNSGVIVSQALRGMAEALGAAEGVGRDLRQALARAAEMARSAVARPVEGTVLSVLSAAAHAVEPLKDASCELAEVATKAASAARTALGRTTGQLDVLARNGVVDAGGAGLTVILETLASVITDSYAARYEVPAARHAPVADEEHRHAEGFGYEVMYLLEADEDAVAVLRGELDRLGDSLVVVGGEGLWNVHVHVDDAGAAVEAGMRAGRPYRLKIAHLEAAPAPRRGQGRGVVAVAAGDGIARLFEEAGAVVVRREPGSSPTLGAVLEAIRRAGTEVTVLPNDSGVTAVAMGAAAIAREEGVVVSVLPTKATVQGLAALAVHDPMRRFDDDVVAMTDSAGHARHGHVWVADRSAVTSAGVCRPGDVLGVIDGDVALIGSDVAATAVTTVSRMLSAGSELVTLIVGAQGGEEPCRAVQDHLATVRPDIEVAVHEGGQGGYPLLIGVE